MRRNSNVKERRRTLGNLPVQSSHFTDGNVEAQKDLFKTKQLADSRARNSMQQNRCLMKANRQLE